MATEPGYTPHKTPPAATRTDEAIRCHARAFEALRSWFAARPAFVSSHHTADEEPDTVLRCELAGVLAETPEWGGRQLRAALEAKGWPGDDELQHLLHRWSCREHREDLARWQQAKDRRRAQRMARRRRAAA